MKCLQRKSSSRHIFSVGSWNKFYKKKLSNVFVLLWITRKAETHSNLLHWYASWHIMCGADKHAGHRHFLIADRPMFFWNQFSPEVTYLIVLGTFGIESLKVPWENILVVFPRNGISKSASKSTICEKDKVIVSCPLIDYYK